MFTRLRPVSRACFERGHSWGVQVCISRCVSPSVYLQVCISRCVSPGCLPGVYLQGALGVLRRENASLPVSAPSPEHVLKGCTLGVSRCEMIHTWRYTLGLTRVGVKRSFRHATRVKVIHTWRESVTKSRDDARCFWMHVHNHSCHVRKSEQHPYTPAEMRQTKVPKFTLFAFSQCHMGESDTHLARK